MKILFVITGLSIGSFMGIGALLLVVDYIVPAPPKDA